MIKIIGNLPDQLQKLKENAIKEAWSFKSKSKNLPEKPEENIAKTKEKTENKFQNFSEIQKFLSPAPKKRSPSLLEALTKNSDNLIIILLIILLMDDKENFPLLLVLLYLMI